MSRLRTAGQSQPCTPAKVRAILVPAGGASFRQILAALASAANPAGSSVFAAVHQAISPLADTAASQQWLAGSSVGPGDPLALLIQTVTGWTGNQMTLFFTLAETFPW